MAATMLAAQKIGAIIAIEREIGLRNYIESGIPLDATLTYDLLVTIFQPGSPLHDGAVILQEDRVAAAACFLPLTVNPRVSRELGTRHRAAIGLTEESDAVAVVVSEETGTDLAGARRRHRARPDAGRAARAAAVAGLCSARRHAPAAAPAYERLMALPPLPPPRAEGAGDRAGDAALADRRRRARRRAQPARAAGVPQHSAGARDRRRPADDGRRAAARIVGAPEPARAGRRRRGARSGDRARRARGCFTSAHRRSARAVRRRGRAGRAGDARARAREVGRAHGAGRARRSTAIRRRGSSSGAITAEPATVEVVGPESRVRAARRGDDRAGRRRRTAASACATS